MAGPSESLTRQAWPEAKKFEKLALHASPGHTVCLRWPAWADFNLTRGVVFCTGVIKDVMLVTLSVTLYGSAVTQIQLAGYALALAGVGFYNYSKIKAAQLAAAATAAAAAAEGDDTKRPKDQDVEAKPLLQKQ